MIGLEQARVLVGMHWYGVGFGLLLVATFFISWATGVLVWRMAIPKAERSLEKPWYLRARAFYPANVAMILAAIFLPITFGLAFSAPQSHSTSVWRYVCLFIASYVGCRMAFRSARRAVGAPLRSKGDRFGQLGFTFFVCMPQLLLSLTAMFLAPNDERGWWLTWGGTMVLSILLTRSWYMAVLRAIGVVRPASARLLEIVKQAATDAGRSVPFTYEISGSMANAFAWPTMNSLTFTKRALDILTDSEIRAICAHELGHLMEKRSLTSIRVAMALVPGIFLAMNQWFARHDMETGWYLASLGLLLLSLNLFARVSRKAEGEADGVAHKHSDEGVYASALEKLYEANFTPVVLRKHSHPSLYDRMVAAGVAPSYPRPEAPSRMRIRLALIPVIVMAVLLLVVAREMGPFLTSRIESTSKLGLILGVWGEGSRIYGRAGELAHNRREFGDAAIFFEAAADIDRNLPIYYLSAAQARAMNGDCRIAREKYYYALGKGEQVTSYLSSEDGETFLNHLMEYCPKFWAE